MRGSAQECNARLESVLACDSALLGSMKPHDFACRLSLGTGLLRSDWLKVLRFMVGSGSLLEKNRYYTH